MNSEPVSFGVTVLDLCDSVGDQVVPGRDLTRSNCQFMFKLIPHLDNVMAARLCCGLSRVLNFMFLSNRASSPGLPSLRARERGSWRRRRETGKKQKEISSEGICI